MTIQLNANTRIAKAKLVTASTPEEEFARLIPFLEKALGVKGVPAKSAGGSKVIKFDAVSLLRGQARLDSDGQLSLFLELAGGSEIDVEDYSYAGLTRKLSKYVDACASANKQRLETLEREIENCKRVEKMLHAMK